MGEFEALLGVNPWTALFALDNFLFLFFMLRRFLFKPVMKMIDDRQKEIDGLYKDAEDAKKDAQAKQQEYDRKLSAAQQTSEQLVREAGFSASLGCEEGINVLTVGNTDCLFRMKRYNRDGRRSTEDFWSAIQEAIP